MLDRKRFDFASHKVIEIDDLPRHGDSLHHI